VGVFVAHFGASVGFGLGFGMVFVMFLLVRFAVRYVEVVVGVEIVEIVVARLLAVGFGFPAYDCGNMGDSSDGWYDMDAWREKTVWRYCSSEEKKACRYIFTKNV
jgi:hypothetical protein